MKRRSFLGAFLGLLFGGRAVKAVTTEGGLPIAGDPHPMGGFITGTGASQPFGVITHTSEIKVPVTLKEG